MGNTAGRNPDHALGNAAKHQTLKSSPRMGSDYDEIGRPLF
jgi:hypothetical protein